MPLTVILVVYVINAVNLIDGIDGLASGLCSISLLTLGAAAAIKGQYLFCMLSFGMLGVLLPFWFYNVFGNAEKGVSCWSICQVWLRSVSREACC